MSGSHDLAPVETPGSTGATLMTVWQALAVLVFLVAVEYCAMQASSLVLDHKLGAYHAIEDADELP